MYRSLVIPNLVLLVVISKSSILMITNTIFKLFTFPLLRSLVILLTAWQTVLIMMVWRI